jgi:exodeoxyribonuclease V alpha subunit
MIDQTTLSALLASKAFNSTDRHFADFMERLINQKSPDLVLASALVSRWLSDGHSCLPLKDLADKPFPASKTDGHEQIKCPALNEWMKNLVEAKETVGEPGMAKPLILDGEHLYLQRFWRYENEIAKNLIGRLNQPPIDIDQQKLADSLKRLFPESKGGAETNWQQVAVFAAVCQRFSVITGGPGTGKTYTVARLLAALLEQPNGEKLNIRLAAPTGKAVGRLQESLGHSTTGLNVADAIKARLQDNKKFTSTIHLLLGTIPNSSGFRHHAGNLLPVDVLMVDEASMLSVSLMSHLLTALKPDARLILVGDKDQLPPVDPGSVFQDICKAAGNNQFSKVSCDDYRKCCGLELPQADGKLLNTVVKLSTNHRSGHSQYLHQASFLINEGKASEFLELAGDAQKTNSTVVWRDLSSNLNSLSLKNKLKEELEKYVDEYFVPVVKAKDAATALNAFGKFRILCAVREGPYGCEAVNRLVEEILRDKGLLPAADIRFGSYSGKPLMTTANNYQLKLFNGDIGLMWKDKAGTIVCFQESPDSIRSIARERLPAHETVYAMTVHKSQGSEFPHVLMILPDRESPILTRQLLYTGLTRAKESVIILAPRAIVAKAIDSQNQRSSKLTERLIEA